MSPKARDLKPGSLFTVILIIFIINTKMPIFIPSRFYDKIILQKSCKNDIKNLPTIKSYLQAQNFF